MTRFRGDVRPLRAEAFTDAVAGPPAERGVTMLTIALGVFITGVACALIVPRVEKAARNARADELVQELRAFGAAFQAQHQRGAWPPAAAAGQVPRGMEEKLGASWKKRTPIGGRFLWSPDALHRGQRYRATILISTSTRDPVSRDRRLLLEVDRRMDDGNLDEGKFRLGYRDQPFFVLEP